MEKVRYHNLLLNEWQKKFGDTSDRTSAVAFLTNIDSSKHIVWFYLAM